MKVLVTGVKGQLGFDVVKCLEARNIDCIGADIEDFDITDINQTRDFIKSSNVDAVIHCAAYTAVDKAEDEKDLCKRINVDGVRNISTVCKELNAKMMYISTDYVFPGTGENFYETDDQTSPSNYYGLTKLQGELEVKELLSKYFIVRISWVFGINGNNFVKTMLRIGKDKECINVVSDQIGSPTYTKDLAPILCDMIITEKYGTYHITNEGLCSWADFAEEIFRYADYGTKVNYILSRDYPTKATRPQNSRLSKIKLDEEGFNRLPHWKDALHRYLDEIL